MQTCLQILPWLTGEA